LGLSVGGARVEPGYAGLSHSNGLNAAYADGMFVYFA